MNPGSAFNLYTDEPSIGMDHPLFMAKVQTAMDATFAAERGQPIEDALAVTRKRMRGLFGDVPAALIDMEVTIAYARAAARKDRCDE